MFSDELGNELFSAQKWEGKVQLQNFSLKYNGKRKEQVNVIRTILDGKQKSEQLYLVTLMIFEANLRANNLRRV